MKILIAYDGSETARSAIADLARAGLPASAQARVLCVADCYPHLPAEFYASPPDPTRAQSPAITRARLIATAAMNEARVDADAAAELVRAIFSGWNVQSQARGGVPSDLITRLADEWNADLIVLGSHGRSLVGRSLLGSVAQNVLAHADCSVRVSRASRSASSPPRLIIGIDGSPGAESAVRAVAARDWPEGAHVHLVSAIDLQLQGAAAAMISADHENRERDLLADAVSSTAVQLRAVGLTVESVSKEGNPRRVLIDEAERIDADCIFLGARGLSRIERFLIGSVSSAVAARANCSVEVIR